MPKTTRAHWIEAGFELLDIEGAVGISAERLARRLNVTRGAFYHHFTSRDDYVRSLLAEWERTYTGSILSLIQPGDTAETLLMRYLDVAASMHPQREVAIRAWAMREPLVADTMQRVDALRLAFATSLCSLEGGAPDDAAFWGRIAHLCFIGAQQTTARPDPEAFRAFFLKLFAMSQRLAALAEPS
ncbi:TetR/AcrR family transcriptional regulator [Ralstonia insidiosa]|uniref:TetR/AcrR family transcriptional regulator n=1 Tax=Ralstonia insidiosa TaxID=190721 RepID=A0A848P5P0_9RALS|nr:TetR/AcrR family transcriptional regulator [Ralstonia insidiosa]NMV40889.1 TetR/AcrR family transcriptional regulator [Ralstonia insidiosa]